MKTKSKTLLAALMAAATIITAAGCGSGSPQNTQSIEDKINNMSDGEIEAAINKGIEKIEKDDKAVTDSKTETAPEKESKTLEPLPEILSAELYSRTIQVGEHIVTFPIVASDFFALGAELDNGKDPSKQVVAASEKNALGQYITNSYDVKIDGYKYSISVWNSTDSNQFLTDLPISRIYGDDLILPKGIRKGSTVEELDEKWGEATLDNLNSRYYYKDYVHSTYSNKDEDFNGNSYNLTLDLDAGIIKTLSYSWKKDSDEMIGYTGDVNTTTIKKKKLAVGEFMLPEYLSDGKMSYEYNGKKYVVYGNFSICGSTSAEEIEYSEETLIPLFDKGLKSDGSYNYDLKMLNDRVLWVESFNEGYKAKVNCGVYTPERLTVWVYFTIYPTEKGENLTADILRAQNDLYFKVAETIKVVEDNR